MRESKDVSEVFKLMTCSRGSALLLRALLLSVLCGWISTDEAKGKTVAVVESVFDSDLTLPRIHSCV